MDRWNGWTNGWKDEWKLDFKFQILYLKTVIFSNLNI